MNKLNKNRIIGGTVIAFAALLFAPAILTPEQQNLANPTLAVQIDSNNPQAKPSQIAVLPKETDAVATNTPVTVPAQPTIQLESLGGADIDNTTSAKPQVAEKPKAKPVPVALQTQASAADIDNSWLRVGSFSSEKNAAALVGTLKKSYPAKLETVKANGKTYHRVLVGPYSSNTALNSAKKALSKKGFSPIVQR